MSNLLCDVFDHIEAEWPKLIDLNEEELVIIIDWLSAHASHGGSWPKRLRAVAEHNQRKRTIGKAPGTMKKGES